MRPVRAAVALVLLLAPLAALPAAEAQSPVDLYLNVVSARSFGCSPDSFTSPDLRVRVLVNDAPAVTTDKAQDQRQPLYASLTRVRATLPARITVEVEEAEPSGLFGTAWVACDVAPGAATRFTHTYAGGPPEEIVARGDDEKAAEAFLAVGREPPSLPSVRALDVNATSARLAWDVDLSGATTGYRLAREGPGPVLLSLGSDVASANLADLCDNHDYTLRLVRDAAPWHVFSNATFRTPNAAPAAPRVLAATRDGANSSVAWEAADMHDAARFDILAGPTQDPAQVRRSVTVGATSFATFNESAPLQPGDAYVRVRLVDTGGLSSVSDAFAVGAPERESTTPFARGCGPTATPGPTVLVPSPRPPATPTVTVSPHGDWQGLEDPQRRDEVLAGVGKEAGEGALLPDWAVLLLVGALGVALGVIVVLALRR